VTRRYLALGDSYTIGEGVSASETWPMQLAAAARAAGVPLADPEIMAKTGWTTTELLAALDTVSQPLGTDFDLVSVLIGVNDQYRGLGVTAFRHGFLRLLTRATGYTAGDARRVVVVSIPDWGITPFGSSDPRGTATIRAEIDRFNAAISAEARQAGAAFVDVTALSRRAANDRSLLAPDGLHPSRPMYALWVQVILPVALSVCAPRDENVL